MKQFDLLGLNVEKAYMVIALSMKYLFKVSICLTLSDLLHIRHDSVNYELLDPFRVLRQSNEEVRCSHKVYENYNVN
ncbi:hypothetical protein DVH24_028242 [Malus domestica]|uniref:Uncharacterized protein n=1 Tax=Malus domestica TaxID=3750 RepID=A0A498HF59_MALDO|nr:hypothetical protein DVH24_028242 [Malus domestica]